MARIPVPQNAPANVGYRRIKMKIDDEYFDTLEKVEVDPKTVHSQQIHYARTTGCGLVITKKMETTTLSRPEELTCLECLEKIALKRRADLTEIEDLVANLKRKSSRKKQ